MIRELILRIVRGKGAKDFEFDQKEMSFLDHLEELRWNIIKAAVGLVLGMVLCAFFADFIVQKILLSPLLAVGLKAQVLAPYGIVMLYIQAVLVSGAILSMPNTLYWLWKFVAPGLMPNERRYVSGIVGSTSFFFFAGCAFGYFVLVPAALTFFANFGTANISLNIAVDRYITFLLALVLGTGLVFELPMVAYFLAKLGIISSAFMRKYRRHAYVLILLIAGIVTPTPDMVTQLLMASPMFVLYELSIFIVKFVYKKKEQKSAEEEAASATHEDTAESDEELW
ncbi:MAG TPA: twin-arginine translocase subunit TatC [Bacteroidota bacterium]|nr:twin-arginine translocase subunit TatC [Bacteroidota bacterium]